MWERGELHPTETWKKEYILGTEDFSNLITCIGGRRKLLMEAKRMKVCWNPELEMKFMIGEGHLNFLSEDPKEGIIWQEHMEEKVNILWYSILVRSRCATLYRHNACQEKCWWQWNWHPS